MSIRIYSEAKIHFVYIRSRFISLRILQKMYKRMENIELARQRSDLLYHILVNSEAKTLDDVVKQICQTVSSRFGDNKSVRLTNMLKQTMNTDDRAAKHALIFFALAKEPSTRSIFLSEEKPRVPPEKFKHFVETELQTLVEKLMRGAFTSLRAFVEDARWEYTAL